MSGQFLRNFVRDRFLCSRTIGDHIARKVIEFAMVGEVLSAEKLYVTTRSLGKDIEEVDVNVISDKSLQWILALARQAAGPREETSDELLNNLSLDLPDSQTFDEQAKQRVYHLTTPYELEESAIENFLQKDIPNDQHVDAETGFSAMKASQALLAATTIAFSIGKTEKGEELLTRMAHRIDANQNFEYMQLIRQAWDYFARGWLREQLGIDKAKFEAYCEEVHQTVNERLRGGRRQLSHYYASYSMRDLLQEVDRNTVALGGRNPNLFDEWDEKEPPTTFLHPPAKEEEISEVEAKLEMELPTELKEALIISNGTEPTRGYMGFRLQVFGGLDSYEMYERPIVDEDDYDYNSQIRPWDEIRLFDELLPSADELEPAENVESQETMHESEGSEDLFKITPRWPKLDRAMSLNWCHQDINGENLYLVEPSLVSQAKTTFDQFYKRTQEGGNEVFKKRLDRLIQDYYGSKEQLDQTEWGVLAIGIETPYSRFWPGIRDWMYEIVWSSRDWEAEDTSPLAKPESGNVDPSQDSSHTIRAESEEVGGETARRTQDTLAKDGGSEEPSGSSRKRTREEAGFAEEESEGQPESKK